MIEQLFCYSCFLSDSSLTSVGYYVFCFGFLFGFSFFLFINLSLIVYFELINIVVCLLVFQFKDVFGDFSFFLKTQICLRNAFHFQGEFS